MLLCIFTSCSTFFSAFPKSLQRLFGIFQFECFHVPEHTAQGPMYFTKSTKYILHVYEQIKCFRTLNTLNQQFFFTSSFSAWNRREVVQKVQKYQLNQRDYIYRGKSKLWKRRGLVQKVCMTCRCLAQERRDVLRIPFRLYL